MVILSVKEVNLFEIMLYYHGKKEYDIWDEFCNDLNNELIDKEETCIENPNDRIIRFVKTPRSKKIVQKIAQKHKIQIKFEEEEEQ